MTESKKAPRGDAVPDALATAPSSTSGTAVSTSSSRPARSEPLAMATEAATAMTRPVVGEVVGRDAGAPDLATDRSQTLLEGAAPPSVEHVVSRSHPAGATVGWSDPSLRHAAEDASRVTTRTPQPRPPAICPRHSRSRPRTRWPPRYPPRHRRPTTEGEPGEAVCDRSDPQRRPGGAQRGGQDEPGRGPAAPRRRHQPHGPGRGRHDGVRLRPRGAQARHLAVPVRRSVRVARPQDQPDRHPRLRRLPGRRVGRSARRRPGGVRRERGRRASRCRRRRPGTWPDAWACPAWCS